MNDIGKKIKEKRANVVVVGLGYVGLPTAIEIAKKGYVVTGFDIHGGLVRSLMDGTSHIGDVSDNELKTALASKRFIATSDASVLKKADVVLLCVPTPLNKNKLPDTSYIESASESVARFLHSGMLVILESSTYPGTTREVVLPILSATGLKEGKDFFLAFSPERIDPGNTTHAFHTVARVVGGIGKKATSLAAEFYRSFLEAEVKEMSSPEAAEMTKILENTFRLVNISLVNELTLLAGKMGIDMWEVIEGAKTKPYGFMPFYPSPKVGGHCIPLDPFYLSWKAREHNFWARFIELAGEINEQMPHYVVTRVISVLNRYKKSVHGSKILVWGVSYKEDIGDPRESAAYDVISDLVKKRGIVEYFDPHVPEFQTRDMLLRSISYRPASIKKYDMVVILTGHSGFDYDELAKNAKLVVDTRNAIRSRAHTNVSWL